MKITTVRMTPELDKEITDYAKREDISKNQAIKRGIRLLLEIEPRYSQKSMQN